DWSLGTIYKGMFEFMILQVIGIALIVIFPVIATWFPEHLQHEARQVKTEEVDDSGNRLEEDPLKTMQDQIQQQKEEEGAGDSLEEDELSKKK
ncbi:MAG TPA: hypothetical protein VGT43_07110, partial [Burkholderiales bacterium]|nr:hypothetical protein [Burkholderiales bacterium]